MTKEEARLLYMDFIYGELSKETEKKLLLFLAEHPELKRELDELGGAQEILQYLPAQEPGNRLILIPAKSEKTKQGSRLKQWFGALFPKSTVARLGVGAFAVCLVLFVTASLTQLQVSAGSNGISIAFGTQPESAQTPKQDGVTLEQLQTVVNRIRLDNAELMSHAIEEIQKQQNYQLEQSLMDFARYVDEQRKADILLFNNSLEGLHETTQEQFIQTDRFLAELVQTLSTNYN